MKRVVAYGALLIAVCLCGVAFAQVAESQTNAHYEHLRILEPLVGTFAPPEDAFGNWDVLAKNKWIGDKKMIVLENHARAADASPDTERNIWHNRSFFYWNEKEGHIEHLAVQPNYEGASAGTVIYKVSPLRRERQVHFFRFESDHQHRRPERATLATADR